MSPAQESLARKLEASRIRAAAQRDTLVLFPSGRRVEGPDAVVHAIAANNANNRDRRPVGWIDKRDAEGTMNPGPPWWWDQRSVGPDTREANAVLARQRATDPYQ